MLGPVNVHSQASSAEIGGHLPVRALVLKAKFAFELVDDISQKEYGEGHPGNCYVKPKPCRTFLEGGPARNRVVFIISGRRGMGEGEAYRRAFRAELGLCFHATRASLLQGSDNALRAPLSDENHPISGRSGSFSRHDPCFWRPEPHSVEDGAAR